jgi:hypothetical protein
MATAHDHAVKAEQLLAMAEDAPPVLAAVLQNRAAIHVDLAKVRLELEARAAENARTDRLLAEVKPTPRSLDPRANQKNGTRRRTDRKSPTVTSAEDSPR